MIVTEGAEHLPEFRGPEVAVLGFRDDDAVGQEQDPVRRGRRARVVSSQT